jgi:WD40 repeat protein
MATDQYGIAMPDGAIARMGTVRPAKEGERVGSVVFAPDGKTLATGGEDGTVRLWEVATSREVRRYGEHPRAVGAILFSPDGKTLASGSHDGTIAFWEAATGSELGSFQTTAGLLTFEFSPDGKILLAACSDEMYRAWDVATGEELGAEPTNLGPLKALAFSPDGQTVGTGSWESIVRLCERDNGKELRQYQGHRSWVQCTAFSQDGRTLASGSPDETIRLWEVRTGKVRLQIVGNKEGLQSMAFSPDGRVLASAGNDTTVLLWDLTGKPPPSKSQTKTPAQMMPSQMENLWRDLSSPDVPTAYAALWGVATNAKQLVPFLKQKMNKLVPVDRQRITMLLAELTHDQVTRRDKAQQDLETVGALCEPMVKAAQAKATTMDLRRRLEKLLAKAQGADPSPETLLALRLLEALELANTTEARQVMESLTREVPPTRITEEAKGSLMRMKRRPATPV